MPQLVWQFKDDRNMQGDDITRKMELFVSHGYKKKLTDLSCYQCYTENMKQFVVNYDLSVFKCTARDFPKSIQLVKLTMMVNLCRIIIFTITSSGRLLKMRIAWNVNCYLHVMPIAFKSR